MTIKGVTFSGTPGSYASTATDATAATFARNTGTNALEAFAQAVQVNLCLKCHDANGQNSGASFRVAGGTATQPFGTSAGTALNVSAHFATGNSSYHPVSGRNNNSYADLSTMNIFNQTAKTDGSTTAWGDLITCWDCHDTSTAGRTIGGANASSTAHGATTTLRGTIWVQSPTLCSICHKAGIYNTPNATTGLHGAGSAFITPSTSQMSPGTGANGMNNCSNCHFSAIAKPARPVAAIDVHGFNKLTNGLNWPGAAYANRPYAFIRNTVQFKNHRPFRSPENTTGSAGCNLGGTGSTCSHGNMPTTANDTSATYTPGGTY